MDNKDCDDRISKLPDAMIIHILSFLPTEDVVRTCILSKRWKLIWYSVPTLFFPFSNVSSPNCDLSLDKFSNYVDNYLEHRKKGMHFSGIVSFKLDLMLIYREYNDSFADKWLAFAVKNKVKEIYLHIHMDQKSYERDFYYDYYYDGPNYIPHAPYYYLPKILENVSYLTILELNGVMLNTSYSYSFPCLKTLSLENIEPTSRGSERDNVDVVFRFLLGCPSLETFRLCSYFLLIDNPFGLETLSLKFIELIDVHYLGFLPKIEAINLESFVLVGAILDIVNLSNCKKITNLALSIMNNHISSSLEALISNLPLLENLTLTYDDNFKLGTLRIWSQHLKSLKISTKINDVGMMKVTIESAPKLAYISYEGNTNFSISMESSNSLNGKIVIRWIEEQGDYNRNWFTNMRNFLVNLNCSWNIVTLHVPTYKARIRPENLKKTCHYPLLNWKHLRVITDLKPERMYDLKDALLWILPSLETLSINGNDIF
ncbi:F-box/LRR-repeat protein At3g26922-like [Cannabis sativa]|uniref:F-box/LRR-repeat protein At3g26922-like n=1 Tax=Cannabis sativa TaxID=3483 RepID=UPI0029CA1E97|nr:F-box/LRR-repeat protein At3g26922-like [Cannabis sativa]